MKRRGGVIGRIDPGFFDTDVIGPNRIEQPLQPAIDQPAACEKLDQAGGLAIACNAVINALSVV